MKNTILKSVISAVIFSGLLLILSIPAHAQNRQIRGKITDQDNQPIADVNIRIEGTDIVRNFVLRSNRRGEYIQLLGAQIGTYRIIVRKDGFQPEYKENVRPELGEEVTLDFTLKPGDSTQKLPFEYTDEDRADYNRRIEAQKKQQQFSKEVRARFDQGVAMFDAGQYDEALAEFNAALKLDSKQPGIIARAGDCYLKLDRNEEALEAYDNALAIDPGDASIYAQKGVVLSRLGKASESQEMFQRSAELDPRGAALNFYNLGVTMYNSSEMAGAADAFRRSVAADSNYAESYYLLGMCLANDDAQFPAALDAFKKYVEIGKKAEQIQIAKEMITALGAM